MLGWREMLGKREARERNVAVTRARLGCLQPAEMKVQVEHDRRARARQRDHDIVENRIQQAFVSGEFDNLPGAGWAMLCPPSHGWRVGRG